MIARQGAVDFAHGLVADNEIGACIQVEGYDLRRLQIEVVYDNGRNLETTDLPVPEATSADEGAP